MKFGFVIMVFAVHAMSYTIGLRERNLVNLPTFSIAKANHLWIDIGHRFDDPLEIDGSIAPLFKNFLGVDGSANIMIACSYGIGNLLDIGLARYRLTKLYVGSARLSILNEPVDHTPFSLAVDLHSGIRTQKNIDDRWTGGAHAIISKSFLGEKMYVGLIPSLQFQGYVHESDSADQPATFSLGTNLAYRLDRMTFAIETNHPLAGYTRGDEIDNINVGFSFRYATYQHSFAFVVANHSFNYTGDMVSGAIPHSKSLSNLRFGFNIIRELSFLSYDKPQK